MHQPELCRRRRRAALPLPLLLGLLAGAAGCDDGRPAIDSSRTEAKVSGVVKIRGKPAEGGGQVSFDPSNADRQVGAIVTPVGPDGTYSLTTFTGDNIIRFSGPMIKDHPELALGTRFAPIAAGENVVDFDLLGESDKPQGATYSRKKAGAPGRR